METVFDRKIAGPTSDLTIIGRMVGDMKRAVMNRAAITTADETTT
jgi:hypothetical protein